MCFILQVTGLWLHNVTSSEVLVAWHSVDLRCLLTYQVFYSTSGTSGTFSIANEGSMLISSSFIHALTEEDIHELSAGNSTLTYHIKAVDYAFRKGPASAPVQISLST